MGSWRSRVRELACANATASNAMSSNCRLRWPASHATFLWSPSERAKSALHARFLRTLRERQLLGKIGTLAREARFPPQAKTTTHNTHHTPNTHITHQTHTSHNRHTSHTSHITHQTPNTHITHQTHTYAANLAVRLYQPGRSCCPRECASLLQ